MHVRLQEWNEIRTGLADNEVVDVEELGDSLERRVSVGIRYVCPMAKVGRVGCRPWDDFAVDVFAENGGFSAAV